MSRTKADPAEQPVGRETVARRFVVTLERSVHCEVSQLAEVEVAAESEAEVRAVVARMMAANHEFEWKDHDVVDEEPEPATVLEVEEIEEGEEGGGE
jgi:hypothetical protein